MTGKKNKRGDRGSPEEETIAAKRSNKELDGQEVVGGNMADNNEVCDAEPTLYDIQNMLEDLQKSVSSILKENAILREDLTQLKSSLQSKEREVSTLKTLFGKVTKANELLKTELEKNETKTTGARRWNRKSVHRTRWAGVVHQKKQPRNSRYTGSVLFYNQRGSFKIGGRVKC